MTSGAQDFRRREKRLAAAAAKRAAPELLRCLKGLVYLFPQSAMSIRDPRHEAINRLLDESRKVIAEIEAGAA